MDNTAHVRAQLVSCNIKNGVVLQFELESDSKDALPKIAMMTRHFVELDITDEQLAMDLEETNEDVDGQLEADFEAEEPDVIEEEDEDVPDLEAELVKAEMVCEPYELPAPEEHEGDGDEAA